MIRYWTILGTFSLCTIMFIAGCGGAKTAMNDLPQMQMNMEATSCYAYDYYRDMDGRITEGRLYYQDGNIRFETQFADSDETIVEIVNLEDKHTYLYSEKTKTGEMQDRVFFSQDAPLPHDVMAALNADNTIILGQEEISEQIGSLYAVNDISLAGTSFSGKVCIDADKGVPLFLEGYRHGSDRNYRYEYRNYQFNQLPAEYFYPPTDIVLTVKR